MLCSVGEEGAERDSPFSVPEWLGMASALGGLKVPDDGTALVLVV